MFDVVITGGTVVDGSGSPGFPADLGIEGDKITAIGDMSQADTGRVVDATGLTVSPGFIDTHTHSDAALLVDPQHAAGLRQGINHRDPGPGRALLRPAFGGELPFAQPVPVRHPGPAAAGPGHENSQRVPVSLPQENGHQYRLPGGPRGGAPGDPGLPRRTPCGRCPGQSETAGPGRR